MRSRWAELTRRLALTMAVSARHASSPLVGHGAGEDTARHATDIDECRFSFLLSRPTALTWDCLVFLTVVSRAFFSAFWPFLLTGTGAIGDGQDGWAELTGTLLPVDGSAIG
jgi:hypothetical protein